MGTVKGSRPVASTAPVSTSAMPCPPCMPEYQTCARAGTRWRHVSVSTALPATMQTTVRGLAATTVSISASSASWRVSRSRSPPVEKPRASLPGTEPSTQYLVVGEPRLEGRHHVGLVRSGEQGSEVRRCPRPR